MFDNVMPTPEISCICIMERMCIMMCMCIEVCMLRLHEWKKGQILLVYKKIVWKICGRDMLSFIYIGQKNAIHQLTTFNSVLFPGTTC